MYILLFVFKCGILLIEFVSVQYKILSRAEIIKMRQAIGIPNRGKVTYQFEGSQKHSIENEFLYTYLTPQI